MLDVCTLRYQALFEVKQIWCQLAQPLTILTENALFCANTEMQCWIVLCRCAPIRYYLSRAELLFRTSGPRGRERSSQVECGHLGHFLLRGVKNFLEAVKVAQIFECTVQLVVGFSSTHLPLRAGANMERPTDCVFTFWIYTQAKYPDFKMHEASGL